MISTDHVRARRRGDTLELRALTSPERDRMIFYAANAINVFRQGLNQKREAIESELADMIVEPALLRPFEGLKKLLFDRCTFKSPDASEVLALRAKVFSIASEVRASLKEGERFPREEVLSRAAEELGVEFLYLEDDLFSDLRGAQRLQEFNAIQPQTLVSELELAQEQAVLLKATELTVQVRCDAPSEYRDLFRQLKFRRLLCEISPLEGDRGYEVKISGPHAIFKSVTKYGLQLAQLLPILRRCRQWKLHARVLWGKDRRDLLDVYLEGERSEQGAAEAPLPTEAQKLKAQLKKSKSLWEARRSSKVLPLPEQNAVCVPDLSFKHPDHKHRVYLEVLGYWSREAVWRRVEWAQQLNVPVIFAVSSRLRVSEEALEGDLPSALLVYKGVITVSALTKLLDELAQRALDHEIGADADDELDEPDEPDEEAQEELEDTSDELEDQSLMGELSLDGELTADQLSSPNSSSSASPEAHHPPSSSEDEALTKHLSGVGLTEVGGALTLNTEEGQPVSAEQPSLFELTPPSSKNK